MDCLNVQFLPFEFPIEMNINLNDCFMMMFYLKYILTNQRFSAFNKYTYIFFIQTQMLIFISIYDPPIFMQKLGREKEKKQQSTCLQK